MTEKRTQLSYLDLAAFYETVATCYALYGDRDFAITNGEAARGMILNLAGKLGCVIDALRADGVDPHWNLERDALIGLYNIPEAAYADMIIAGLQQRGYKIVKDAT